MDLKTLKPNGQAWGFDRHEDRVLAGKMVREQRPTWIISSPPCTVFSSWNHDNNVFLDTEQREARMQTGRPHLMSAMELCRHQLAMGQRFANEQPAGATSWNEKAVQVQAKDDIVHVTRLDQCTYGLVKLGPNQKMAQAMKPARWKTRSIHTANNCEAQPATASTCTNQCEKAVPRMQLSTELSWTFSSSGEIRDTWEAEEYHREATERDDHQEQEEEASAPPHTPATCARRMTRRVSCA